MSPNAQHELVEHVREMVRLCDRATLATVTAGGGGVDGDGAGGEGAGNGAPYASLVITACDMAGRPLLLLSALAEHTRNIEADPRASLLYHRTEHLADPLVGARASLQGVLRRVEDETTRKALVARFIRRHEGAKLYASFSDFSLYRMTVDRIHLVAGFGRIQWIDGGGYPCGISTAALEDAEGEIISHMNRDHSDAIGLYANVLAGRSGVGWKMTGIDPQGIDLRQESRTVRIGFDRPVTNAVEARAELVRLAHLARGG